MTTKDITVLFTRDRSAITAVQDHFGEAYRCERGLHDGVIKTKYLDKDENCQMILRCTVVTEVEVAVPLELVKRAGLVTPLMPGKWYEVRAE